MRQKVMVQCDPGGRFELALPADEALPAPDKARRWLNEQLVANDCEPLRREIRERYAQADLRPEDSGHQRERALRALDIEGQPVAALGHARRNLVLQREPFDLWLFARCAQAASDPAALAEVRRLAQQQGLRDARLDSL